MSKTEVALSKAKEINESLLRMQAVLPSQLDQVNQLSQTISQDSEILKDTSYEYREALVSSLEKSGKELENLKAQEKRNLFTFKLALAFFILVCAWILIRRTRIIWWIYVAVKDLIIQYVTEGTSEKEDRVTEL